MQVKVSMRQAMMLTASLGAGFGIGYVAKGGGSEAAEVPGEVVVASPLSPRGIVESAAGGRPLVAAQMLKSPHTLEELLAMPADELYGPLALWLADAEPEDFDACWRALSQRASPDHSLFDMVFLQWTGKDPHGAIRAAAEGEFSHIPWWAWAKNDADEAFAYARAYAPERVGAVMRAIGQSDPARAMRLLAAHPDLDASTGLDGILSGLSRDDPEAAVKLALEHGRFGENRAMEAWLREDPHAAWEWFLANRAADRHNQMTGDTIRALEREHPEMLAEFAASTPPGALKRKLEAAEFRLLATTDPEKALAQARATDSERVALERMSQLAALQARDDPAKAKELLVELLGRFPDPAAYGVHVERLGGLTRSGGVPDELSQALRVLATSEPAETMNLLVSSAGQSGRSAWDHLIGGVAQQWAESHADAYADWALRLPQPEIRDQALGVVVDQLSRSKSFSEAMEYAAEIGGPNRNGQQHHVLHQWHRADPKAAAAWFQQAPMAEEERRRFESIFSQP
jgi:hypothetical protein